MLDQGLPEMEVVRCQAVLPQLPRGAFQFSGPKYSFGTFGFTLR